jgi:O-antigen/teichoic acid export membrane protein
MLDDKQQSGEGEVARRGTARNVAWNYTGYAYQMGITLFLTAYVVRHISVVEYGLLLFVMSLSATLFLLDMGLSNILIQAYVKTIGDTDKSGVSSLLNTAFLTLTALGALGMLSLFALAASLPGPFNIASQYLHEASILFVIAGLVVQVGLPSMALEYLFQASQRYDRVNQAQLMASTAQLVLSIVVLAAGYRIVALASVQLVVSVLRFLFLVVALPSSIPATRLSFTQFSWSRLKPLVHLSKWAFVNNICIYLFDLLVWVILGSLGSMKEAAIFALASKIPRQLWNLVDKGGAVALPLLSEFSSENDSGALQRTYLNLQKLIFGAVLPFIVFGCLFAGPLIDIWAGNQYAGAVVVMRWLFVAAFAHAIIYSSDLLLYACGDVKKAALISVWSVALSIASASLLISRFGAAGMAAGMALTQLLISCTWFTASACRRSQITGRTLLTAILSGLEWPLVVLCGEIVLLWIIASRVSSFWLLAAAIVSGTIYLAVWGWSTALPLYRIHARRIA